MTCGAPTQKPGYLLVNALKQDDDGESMAATCPPYRPGAVSPQTAISVSPALSPDTCLSHPLDPEEPDELTHVDGPSVPDELPSAGETDMNTTSDCETTLFTGISRIAEKSEELREPDFEVQIVPASVSSSELSAHQMGVALAGTLGSRTILQNVTDPVRPDGFSLSQVKFRVVSS